MVTRKLNLIYNDEYKYIECIPHIIFTCLILFLLTEMCTQNYIYGGLNPQVL